MTEPGQHSQTVFKGCLHIGRDLGRIAEVHDADAQRCAVGRQEVDRTRLRTISIEAGHHLQ
ncbi:hypothetical protein D3C71_945740 [compost metagenome]